MSNRTTLAQLREMDVRQAASLPIDQIALLLEDVATQKADTKQLDEKLNDALGRRYADRAAEIRRAGNKDTGRVSINDGDYIVRADLPKKVEWDEAKLRAAIEEIVRWGEKPSEYVVTKLTVSETKYNAWPTSIRMLFKPARTLGVGKASFAVERRAA